MTQDTAGAPKLLVLDELVDFDWDRELIRELHAVELSSARLESARANLLMTAMMGTSLAGAAIIEPRPARVQRFLGITCESCGGKRSSEANYCPRCGHRRRR